MMLRGATLLFLPIQWQLKTGGWDLDRPFRVSRQLAFALSLESHSVDFPLMWTTPVTD